jgi:two-component system, NarL family, response regulator DevR
MSQPVVRLLLVDDHAVLRLGLRTLFERAGDFLVVGEAETVADAIVQARTQRPDVVIADLRLPDGNGVEACREIRSERPETRVVVLTSYSDEDAVMASIVGGAAGYLLKQTPPRQLVEAIRTVARGGSLLDPAVTGMVLDRLKRAGDHDAEDPLVVAGLSEQERNILPLIAEGKTNREIAGLLVLSERTVKTYVSNILQKLHLSRRSEAAAFAARQRRRP